MISPVRAADARSELVRVLRLDAIGPDPGDPEQGESLPQAPSEWYLTGFLVPYQAKAEERQDPTSNEDVDQGGSRRPISPRLRRSETSRAACS